jgi:hypothetical protein
VECVVLVVPELVVASTVALGADGKFGVMSQTSEKEISERLSPAYK